MLCACYLPGSAHLSPSDTIGDQQQYKLNGSSKGRHAGGTPVDSGFLVKGIPDGKWMVWYKNGQAQFIRTYSADKWQQYQNEKTRYHPKRVSLPITKLFHDNKEQAEKYTTAINSFCGLQHCARVNESIEQVIDNNAVQEHYHPPFKNGLLHGIFVNYFSDGAIKDSGNYKNGLPEGLWIKWTDDKQFYWKGFFEHGMKDKEWKLYTSKGRLARIIFYESDKYLGRKDLVEGVEIDE